MLLRNVTGRKSDAPTARALAEKRPGMSQLPAQVTRQRADTRPYTVQHSEIAMANDTGDEENAAQEPADGSASLDLGSTLDITMVADVHARLRQALDAGTGLTLNGGELDRVDAAGLQLLAAFAEHARSLDIPVSWSSVSPCLEENAFVSGLGDCLGLPAT